MWVPVIVGVLVSIAGAAAYGAWHPAFVERTRDGRTTIFAGAYIGPLLIVTPVALLLFDIGGTGADTFGVTLCLVIVALALCTLLVMFLPPRRLLPRWFRETHPTRGWGR